MSDYRTFMELIAEHIPNATARGADALAAALVVAIDPHAARIAWLRQNRTPAEVNAKPIQAIKDLRCTFLPTPTLREAKDAVDAYRAEETA